MGRWSLPCWAFGMGSAGVVFTLRRSTLKSVLCQSMSIHVHRFELYDEHTPRACTRLPHWCSDANASSSRSGPHLKPKGTRYPLGIRIHCAPAQPNAPRDDLAFLRNEARVKRDAARTRHVCSGTGRGARDLTGEDERFGRVALDQVDIEVASNDDRCRRVSAHINLRRRRRVPMRRPAALLGTLSALVLCVCACARARVRACAWTASRIVASSKARTSPG